MKRINISTPKHPNTFALVDDSDFRWLSQWKWHLRGDGYVARSVRGKPMKTIWMQREVMSTPEGFETDHINGDKLDNRRSNLRIVTHTQNQHNRRMATTNTTGYLGVSKRPHGRWQARIAVNNRDVCLGTFATIEDAARAYDAAVVRFRGSWAKRNEWQEAA